MGELTVGARLYLISNDAHPSYRCIEPLLIPAPKHGLANHSVESASCDRVLTAVQLCPIDTQVVYQIFLIFCLFCGFYTSFIKSYQMLKNAVDTAVQALISS